MVTWKLLVVKYPLAVKNFRERGMIMRKHIKKGIAVLTITALILSGCGLNEIEQNGTTTNNSSSSTSQDTINSTTNSNSTGDNSTTADNSVTGGITTVSTTSKVVVDTEFTARDLEVGYEESTSTYISLNDSNTEVNGSGATVSGNTITIKDEGTYIFSGNLSDGQILVDANAKEDKVQIVLSGVSITSKNSAPIYIKSADKVFVTLDAGTENALIDGAEYIQTDDNTVDGVIFSKVDLTINGSGSLTITGNYKHGIVSKDDIVITGGTITITAVKDAINGKDSVKIKDGTLTLSASTGNGIQSKHDEDETKGYVYISGGNITVVNSQEGIEGTVIMIEGGNIDITAEDDGLNSSSGVTTQTSNTATLSDDTSITTMIGESTVETTSTVETRSTVETTSTTNLIDELGIVLTSSATDATSSASTTENWQPGDGTKPERTLPEDGTMPERTLPEGDFNQGEIPTRGFGGNMGGGNEFAANSNCYISISGGVIQINANGDGIDSNGNVYISGGTTYVSGPTNSGNAGFDYNGTADITGGVIVVAGSAGMAQGFSETSTQYSLLYNFTGTSAAGTDIILKDKDGNIIMAYTPEKQYQSVVISAPELSKDETYTLTSGEQTAEITLTSIVTSNGQEGIGVFGGKGGRGTRP